MSLNNLASLVTVVISLLLGIYIIYNNPRSKVNLSFAVSTFCVTGWILVNYLADTAKTPGLALIWARLALVTPILIPISLLYFSRVFPVQSKPIKPLWWVLLSIPAVVFLTLVPTSLNIETVSFTDVGQETVVGPLYIPFGIYFVIYILGTLYNLYSSYRRQGSLYRNQIFYLFFGLALFFLFSFITQIILPLIGFSTLVSTGPVSSLIFLFAVSYAIVRHRLLDIRLVIARSLAYTLLVIIVGVIYTAGTFTFSNLLLKEAYQPNQLIISTVLTLIVAFTFQPLRRYLEKATDKIFFKNPYDSGNLLSELTHIMSRTLLLDQLSLLLLHKLSQSMKISRGSFVLLNEGKIFALESLGFTPKLKLTDKEVFALQAPNKTLILENMEEGSAKETMRALKITMSIPLKTGTEEVGLLLLGEKSSGDAYSSQDLKVLDILAPEVSVAIQNAKSYEEIRRFNITLKEEVDRATKELKVANERLRELDKLKDEFISVTSHDLRTPLTAIKSYLWLALHGKAGKINEKMDFYLGRSYQSAERMLALIGDLLDVSRIERGKIELHLEPADLGKVLEMVLDELQSKAIEGDIKLSLTMPKTPLPEVMLDQERFPEIITNLVGNALKFTPKKGSVTVTAIQSKDMVEVSVTDSGVGIGKEDMPKLFSKFGRLDNSYKAIATTGGTGLGLYITKNLVQLHGGDITVLSQLGKGTTFTFSLKVATEMEKKQKKYIPAPQGVIINPELMGQFRTPDVIASNAKQSQPKGIATSPAAPRNDKKENANFN